MKDQLAIAAVPSSGEKTFLLAEMSHSGSDIVVSISLPACSPHPNKDNSGHYHFITQSQFAPLMPRIILVKNTRPPRLLRAFVSLILITSMIFLTSLPICCVI